jgi:hypothetical protein
MNAAPIKVWGIAALAASQKAAFEAHCTGDCGKISMGGVIDDDYTGGLFVCTQDTCPHMEKESPEPYGTTMSFGRPHEVWLRILKPEGVPA